jgi:thioredoxin-related protein
MRCSAPRLLAYLLVTATCFLRPARAAADEVSWRYDYNAARKEAQEKNRPLILDFMTTHCRYCDLLDSTTFRDPVVVSIMNDRFVPLKVDAEQNNLLAEALHIERYPTMILAAPDGKILGTLEGYRDAETLVGILQRAVASVTNPPWMVREFDEAGKAAASSQYARAIGLLKHILEDGQDRPVQAKARQLLQDLEQQAAGRLARARGLEEKGQNGEALDILSDLIRDYPGTQAASEGGQVVTSLSMKPEVKALQRTRHARELLAEAREEYRSQQYLSCMDRCEALAAGYGDLPEGTEAMQLVAQIKANPEWMRQACDTLSDRLGLLYLSLAESLVKKGDAKEATACLEVVIRSFPGTRTAEAAQSRLAQLQGPTARHADFQKKDGAKP